MGWKLNLCLAAVGAYLLGYRPAPFTQGLQSVASLGYTFVLPSARVKPDGLTSAIRNVTSDYDQARCSQPDCHCCSMPAPGKHAAVRAGEPDTLCMRAAAHPAGEAVLHRALRPRRGAAVPGLFAAKGGQVRRRLQLPCS